MKNILETIVPENRDNTRGWLYKIGEIWLRRRVWLRMIDLWESECERKGAIKLQPGESITAKILFDGPLTEDEVRRVQDLASVGDDTA